MRVARAHRYAASRRAAAFTLGLFWLACAVSAVVYHDSIVRMLAAAVRDGATTAIRVIHVNVVIAEATVGLGLLFAQRIDVACRYATVLGAVMLVATSWMYPRLVGHECGCLAFAGLSEFGAKNLVILGVAVGTAYWCSAEGG